MRNAGLSLQNFRPITVELPKVLLPLVNTPMLNYSLEWLATNDVEEVLSWIVDQELPSTDLCLLALLEANHILPKIPPCNLCFTGVLVA